MRGLLFLLLAVPLWGSDRTPLNGDLCSTGLFHYSELLETTVLRSAVEQAFGPAELISDRGGESAVFRVFVEGLHRVVKVSRYRDPDERRRYLDAAARQKLAVEAAFESPYRASARFLTQVLAWRTVGGGIPCKIERDQGPETLHDHLQSDFPGAIFARPTRADVILLMRNLARALGGLHFGGHVHRDVKPDNISIRHLEAGWTLSILDLGLVTKIGEATEGTSGAGHRQFSRPAQLEGGLADPLDDLYSLGQILKMLTERMPPAERTDLESLARDLTEGKISTIELLLERLN